jgi:hypothetical protein
LQFRDRQYLSAFLSGGDGAGVFDYRTRVLDPRARVSYQQYVARSGTTTSGKLVAESLTVLKANGYRRTAAVNVFLRSRVFLQ